MEPDQQQTISHWMSAVSHHPNILFMSYLSYHLLYFFFSILVVILFLFWQDGPGSVSISGGKSGMEGSILSLSCMVDSHPTATILWYKIGQSKQVRDGFVSIGRIHASKGKIKSAFNIVWV